jgi:hypothetical protein
MPTTSSAPSFLEVLRSLFVKDIGRKIVALVLAIGLWFLISKILRIEIPKDLHVVIVSNAFQREMFKGEANDGLLVEVPSELVIQQPKDLDKGLTSARVLVSGPRTLLEGEGGLRISARYSVPPTWCDSVSPRAFIIDPSAILINGFKPKQGVSVEIQEVPVILLARREVRRVHIDFRNFPIVGKPMDGWELDEKNKGEQVFPETREVEISGPADDVLAIVSDPTRLLFMPIDVDHADRPLSVPVSIDRTRHPTLTLEDPKPRIKVDVRLSEVREERTLANVRIVPLFLDELIDAKPRLRDLPASESPIQPELTDDKWKSASVVLSAPRTFWVTNDPDLLRERVLLWVNLRQMIASGVRIKSLTVESSGMRSAQNEPWPVEVQFKKVTPDLISVTLHE